MADMEVDALPKQDQENLITLLCFDDENCRIIRDAIDWQLFEGPYRLIASQVYAYIDEYNCAPADMTGDLFTELYDDTKTDTPTLRRILLNMHELKKSINADFVMSRMTKFIRQQRLKVGIMQAVDLIQNEGADAIDEITTVH